MDEKAWVIFVMPGLGETAVWVDKSEFEAMTGVLNVENVTQIILDGSGRLAMRKVTTKAVVTSGNIPAWYSPQPEMVQMLSNLWDAVPQNGKIVLPSGNDKRRFGLV